MRVLGERSEVIRKGRPTRWPPPVVADYDATVAAFTWDDARRALDGLPGGRGLNIAHEAVDRHAAGPRSLHHAVRWLSRDGRRVTITYAELRRETDRFASALRRLGVQTGDTVALLLGRIPELHVAVLGTLKAGGVVAPLFSAFGPEPIHLRLDLAAARVLVTTAELYDAKVAPLRPLLPALEHVLVVTGDRRRSPATIDLHRALDAADDTFEIAPTDPEQLALLHFTSGTTGTPKGALHVHDAVVAHQATARMALDLHPTDVFWCTADPGWVTGMSYGIIAPLVIGATTVVDEAEFEVERWYRILRDERVDVWYTAPTAVRMLMRAGTAVARGYGLHSLRFAASVGEPLNAEGVVWGLDAFDQPIHDNWWQTETGGIMIANFAAMDVKPGSMGKPIPGVEAAILSLEGDRSELVEAPMAKGQLALRPGWPSMFRGYLNEEARYAACFKDGWYLTGDLAMRDEDGYFWFVGRADDVIKSSGHLIGPFEVETVLMEHEAVAEAAAIGLPDERAGEVVKAYVTLKRGFDPTEDLRREVLGHARRRLGAAIAPRQVEIVGELPHTRSGKIMRRLLRARELGLPEGDLSTLEGGS